MLPGDGGGAGHLSWQATNGDKGRAGRRAGMVLHRLAGSCLVLGYIWLATAGTQAVLSISRSGPVYTVAEVQQRLALDPTAWIGRTVWVRGTAEACLVPVGGSCHAWLPVLADQELAGEVEPLLLAWGEPSPLLASLRRLPLLGWLVPPPPEPRWWRLATYQLRVRAEPFGRCGAARCYGGLVLSVD